MPLVFSKCFGVYNYGKCQLRKKLFELRLKCKSMVDNRLILTAARRVSLVSRLGRTLALLCRAHCPARRTLTVSSTLWAVRERLSAL